MAKFFQKPKPVVLVIMDGVGVAPPGTGNAVTLAKTPFLDTYWPKYPHTYLKAAGLDVGLPNGVDGNSEVGHSNIGAGKVLYQDLPRIDMAITNQSFYKNPVLLQAIEHQKQNNSNLHLIGLLGSGQVHSSISHIFALVKLFAEQKVNGDKVFLHIFTDGRDSPPEGAIDYLEQLEIQCKAKSIGRIATICGRIYGMDRDKKWDRTKKAYEMITQGVGYKVKNWRDVIDRSYKSKITDEFIEPHVILENGSPLTTVKPGDSIIFFNFRPDRAVQLTQAFVEPNFTGFERTMIENTFFVGMTEYDKNFPKNQAFPPEHISTPLGKIISDNRLTQLRISESEKFPHITYFLNCENSEQYPGEDRIEVPSPRDVTTYDEKPEMSAPFVTDIVLEKIDQNIYDFIAINFANADMVAHSGILEPTIKAIEVVDSMIGRIVAKVLDKNGAVIITADHGNAEELIDPKTGGIDTKHSINPVPFIAIKSGELPRELTIGILSDIAPTVLYLLGIERPITMQSRNLLV